MVVPASANTTQSRPVPPPMQTARLPDTTNTEPVSRQTTTIQREIKIPEHTPISETSVATKTSATPATNVQIEKFSSMLHQAIDRHKHYPFAALRMRQQGTARVRFHLFEDGRVEDVTLLQTSGYQSLDHSALHAVQSIAPFTPARDYLTNDEHFDVDIIFRI